MINPISPFGVFNPEQLDADYIARNFVDVYTDLLPLREKCNTFILGARGTGKSMLLRSLEPEVMLKAQKVTNIQELPYLAVHIPLKKAEFAVPELNRISGYSSIALGEHLLASQVMFRLTNMLIRLANNVPRKSAEDLVRRFDELYDLSCGLATPKQDTSIGDTAREIFCRFHQKFERELITTRQYFSRLSFSSTPQPYTGALIGFLDFIVPLSESMQELDGLPNVPIFLMLDDADNLPQNLQRNLNSWVSRRSTHAVCLKITTQLGYATLRTNDNRIIESPHDFAEINPGTVYTTDHGRYSKRVQQIVERRLSNAGINVQPEVFFPNDLAQEKRLKEIEAEIVAEEAAARAGLERHARSGPARIRDVVTRTAIPRLMRERAGSSRSSHTFSYAGFKSLVDLSSGVIRWFLEPASRMYDRVSETPSPVSFIPVQVQDEIILDWSREFILRLSQTAASSDTDSDSKIEPDPEASLHAFGHETILYEQLKNLLTALGKLFRGRLLNPNASEQRVFSIIVRGRIPQELQRVFGLGVRLGYLQDFDNAAKEALGGRAPRYVMARRLGPYYKLDVSGYAAHLSVAADELARALRDPDGFASTRLGRATDARQLELITDEVSHDNESGQDDDADAERGVAINDEDSF